VKTCAAAVLARPGACGRPARALAYWHRAPVPILPYSGGHGGRSRHRALVPPSADRVAVCGIHARQWARLGFSLAEVVSTDGTQGTRIVHAAINARSQ
jgi:hypothetical protein